MSQADQINVGTHRDNILQHLKSGGKLTGQKSQELWGRRRLPARICELKKLGYPIDKHMIAVTTRYGDRAHVAEYFLQEE